MAGIFDSLANLPKMLNSAASSGITQANKLTSTFAPGGAVDKKIDEAVNNAEIYLGATLALQAISTAAAVGILLVHINSSKKRRVVYLRRNKRRGGRK